MYTGSGVRTVQIVSHDVSRGETLSSIADDYYGTPVASGYLADVNGVREGTLLEVGAVLDVPVGSDDIARYERRTRAKIHYNRGTALAERGDLGKAEEEFRTALRIDPRFADAGYNLGVTLLMSNEASRAVAILEQVVRVRENDPVLLFALGKAFLDDRRTGEALRTFGQVLALDPLAEEAHFARAVALLELDRDDEAVLRLDSYLRRFPEGAHAERARAMLEELARRAPAGAAGGGTR